jgi:hypothetical protein
MSRALAGNPVPPLQSKHAMSSAASPPSSLTAPSPEPSLHANPEEDLATDSPGSSVLSPAVAPPVVGVQTRLQKCIKNPKIYKDGTMRYG